MTPCGGDEPHEPGEEVQELPLGAPPGRRGNSQPGVPPLSVSLAAVASPPGICITSPIWGIEAARKKSRVGWTRGCSYSRGGRARDDEDAVTETQSRRRPDGGGGGAR